MQLVRNRGELLRDLLQSGPSTDYGSLVHSRFIVDRQRNAGFGWQGDTTTLKRQAMYALCGSLQCRELLRISVHSLTLPRRVGEAGVTS